MRVLAWPIYSYPANILADSGYICFRNLIQGIPEWTWHVVVPEWADGTKYRAPVDELDDLPNVKRVPVPMHTLYRMQEIGLDQKTMELYSPQIGEEPIDAVVCGSNQIASHLANMWSIRVPDYDRPLIVAWDLLTRDDRNKGWKSEDTELVMHFAGAAVADFNVFGSEMMRWMTAEMLRKIFSPSMVRDTMRRSDTIYAGVPVEKVVKATAGAKKRDKFTVFYGGRMGPVKRVDELTEIAELAFSYGRDMGMVVCTGSTSPRIQQFAKDYPMVELHTGTGQKEAWELMSQCHVGFSWSKHEMIGSMFVEEMVAGMPVMATPHRWLKSLLPDEYPYWADNKDEAGAHLRLLYEAWKENPDEYDAGMRPWAQYVRDTWDSALAGPKFRDRIEAVVAETTAPKVKAFEGGAGRNMKEIVGQCLQDGQTYRELLEAVRKTAFKHTFIGNTLVTAGRSNPNLDVYRMAKHLGWTVEGVDPILREPERKEA